MGFYRPTFEGGTKFTSWTHGTNECAITNIYELTGADLDKKLELKNRNREVKVKKLDINVVIEVKKPEYEYAKKLTYCFAFDRDDKGNIVTNMSKDGKMDLFNAYDFFDMLLCTKTTQIGLNEQGDIVTQDGKKIANLVSFLKTMINPSKYNFFVYMIKDDKYWNAKILARKDNPSSVEVYERKAQYWNNKQPAPQQNDTSFDFGDVPKESNNGKTVIDVPTDDDEIKFE